MAFVQTIPSELLLEIFDLLPRRDLKSSRLVCRLFKNLVSERQLFRKTRLSFTISQEYSYCREHEWFVVRGKEKSASCASQVEGNDCQPCPDSPGDGTSNPFEDRISAAINSEQTCSAVFAHAEEFTLSLPPLGWILDTAAAKQRSRWDWVTVLDEAHQALRDRLLLQLLTAMPHLKTVYADARPDRVTRTWVHDGLASLCKFVSEIHPEAELHVAVSFRGMVPPSSDEKVQECAKYLSNVTSLTLGGLWYSIRARKLDQLVWDLKERSPNLKQPNLSYTFERRKESAPGAHDQEAMFYIGPKEKMFDRWYLPTEKEIEDGLEDKHVKFWRVSWYHPAGQKFVSTETNMP